MKKFITILFLLIPFLTLAQENPVKKKAYYFFGEQCPHCKTVDEYFQANGIYEKYEITKLEAVSNPFNGKLFLEFGKAFGVPDWGGVPAIVFGDKYLLGDKPIIENFSREIDAAANANALPDPEKIGKSENKDGQPASVPSSGTTSDEGNKNNYFPVVVIALVALGTGALIFVNRKKT